jgi:hypothetical protein
MPLNRVPFSLNSVAEKWNQFLEGAGAVEYNTGSEWMVLLQDQELGIGKRAYSYDEAIAYAKSSWAHCNLCDGDKPKPPHRLTK